MTIAVTGASGQLGALVIDHLLDRVPASEVVAVARDAEKARRHTDRGVEVRVADYTDRAALESALAGVDRLLLVSGNEVGQRTKQHTTVIEAAKAAGVGLVVYTSVLHADTSSTLVAPEHRETEAVLAESGLPHVLLRNGWYHENYAATLEAARYTGTIVTSAGAGRVASASRSDLAEAAAIVLTSDGLKPVYELSGDVAWTQDDLAAAVADVLGSPVEVQHVDAAAHTAALTAAGLDEGTVHFVVATDGHIAEGALADTPGDLSALLGRPTTSLVDTLRTLA